jgi:hypothetical protein
LTLRISKEESIGIWKKIGDSKIIRNRLNIPEEFVNDFIEFNKIPKNIKNSIPHPYSLLRHNEIIRLISRAATMSGMIVNNKEGKNLRNNDCETLKFFNSIFDQSLEQSFEPLCHRSVQQKISSTNSGKLCPKCQSKKQAEKINEIKQIDIKTLKDLELSHSQISKFKSYSENNPEWKCVDCGHEWSGALGICFPDSDQI